MKTLTLTKDQLLKPSSILEIEEVQEYLSELNNGIIVLKGEYGAGKDVWAQIIQSCYPQNTCTKVYSFASDLRLAFNEAGFTYRTIDCMKRTDTVLPTCTIVQEWDVSGLTMRQALIKVAEANKAKYGLDYYTKNIKNKIETLLQNRLNSVTENLRIIVTDCRFEVEMDMLNEISQKFGIPITVVSIPENLPKIEVV